MAASFLSFLLLSLKPYFLPIVAQVIVLTFVHADFVGRLLSAFVDHFLPNYADHYFAVFIGCLLASFVSHSSHNYSRLLYRHFIIVAIFFNRV